MKKTLAEVKGHLMSGISFVLPLIIGASLVVALPKMIALGMGVTSLDPYAETEGFKHVLYLIEQVGWTGIGLINTVLAVVLLLIRLAIKRRLVLVLSVEL